MYIYVYANKDIQSFEGYSLWYKYISQLLVFRYIDS